MQKFLHAHGPADPAALAAWLGCGQRQAKRLWQSAAAETVPVRAAGKARHVLAADLDALRTAVCDTGVWRMLGPHDPYLDLRDRTVLLDDVQKQQKAALSVEMVLFEPADAAARQSLEQEAAQYAAFRGAALRAVVFQRAG